MSKITLVFYSMYGHMKVLMEAIKAGAESAGVTVELFQVPETLPEEVLEKMGAKGLKDESIPVITHEQVGQLPESDGFIFGLPTRFGMASAQMKAFFDSTGSLWAAGALRGKPAGLAVSTNTQGGGQETTALTAVTQLVHHGMLYVPMGYSDPSMFGVDEVRGGSPYGPGTIAGPDGSRMPSETELNLAKQYGKYFAETAVALKNGRTAE